MGINSRINGRTSRNVNDFDKLSEQLFREEKNYRADKLVEKWSNVAEVGKGIKEMNTRAARNLATLLENQKRVMSRMNEAQLSTAFNGLTPENMLRLVRLAYPNSIRGELFTEFAMETANDSIKYIEPRYTNAMRDGFDWSGDGQHDSWTMKNRFDNYEGHENDVMYESAESRYATELINVPEDNITVNGGEITVEYKGDAFGDEGENFIDKNGVVYLKDKKKGNVAIAVQNTSGAGSEWFGGKDVPVSLDGSVTLYYSVDSASIKKEGKKVTFTVTSKTDPSDDTGASATLDKTNVAVIARYNSEQDLTGKYLGEVQLEVRSYTFNPRPITLGVSWTQLSELVLDTSFNVSAEEMLMDSASQEIKKTLDFQAVKFARDIQKTKASGNFVQFNAEAASKDNDDSYYHTAQLVGQAISRIADLMLNKINRGGVTSIVGGPAAVNYLQLNKEWSSTGKQSAIGGHKVGQFGGIPVFKVPSNIIPDDTLITTWKNDSNENDVAIAIGTLLPFYSTGVLQRKNLYKEAAVARFEDTVALQPAYLGRIQINGIREISNVK